MPWLLFAQPWDSSIGATRPLYFSDSGFTTSPAESPANTYWDRRIDVPYTLTRTLYSRADATGRSEVGVGNVILANDDGALDALADYDWDGRLVEIRHTAKRRPALADFAVIFSGTAERVVAGDRFQIAIRDLQVLLDEPYQKRKFLGTGGIEGPVEFKDRRFPRLLGVCRQFAPVQLGVAPRPLYIYSDGPVGGPLAVLDQGMPLTFHSDHPTLAALQASATPAGQYATCNALALIQLGALPSGVVTVSAEGAAPAGTVLKRFADLAQHVIVADTPLTAADFAPGAVAAMNAKAGQTLGLWYDGSGEASVRAILDQMAATVGGAYGFDLSRRIVMDRLDPPAATPDFIFTERDFDRLVPREAERRLKRQTVAWGRRWRPLGDEEVAAAVTDRTPFTEEWRIAAHESAATAAASLLAREERLDSLFDVEAEAVAEAQRRVALFGPLRQGFEAQVAFVPGVMPGMTVEFRHPRFGLAGGRRFRVLGVEGDAAADRLVLRVWG